MGMMCSKSEPKDKAGQQNHKKAEQDLKRRKAEMSKEVKLLLLGAGESGKSTIFKQMKIIHQAGYRPEECEQFRKVIYSNTLYSMKVLVHMCIKLGIDLFNSENRERAQRVVSVEAEQLAAIGEVFTPDLGRDIAALWLDEGIRTCYGRRNEFQLNDSAAYYFNSVERIAAVDYVPNDQDVLRSRVKTTGIVETDFHYGGLHFRLFDLGGQRSERKKWIYCFQGVTAVIFVSSLSEYDQKCYEDDSTPRMQESLSIWEEVVNKWFTETSVILFLNKTDLFESKISNIDLKVCFPEYNGGCNSENARTFIREQFLSRNRLNRKQIYVHFTCATDTTNVRKVFDDVKNIILEQNLQDNGLL